LDLADCPGLGRPIEVCRNERADPNKQKSERNINQKFSRLTEDILVPQELALRKITKYYYTTFDFFVKGNLAPLKNSRVTPCVSLFRLFGSYSSAHVRIQNAKYDTPIF
jgi:hypothetical protein